MTARRALTAILSATAAALALPALAGAQTLEEPPRGGIYHAAYPDFRDTEDHVRAKRVRRFQRLAGKRIAWTYFSNNWGKRIRFPAEAVRRIRSTGSVPFIRLMARSNFEPGGPDPRYRLQRIIDGDFDAELAAWGQAAAATPHPLLVEFGTEVNGFWFPWNGTWNGRSRTDGYGDPALADGPERFRDAFRHVHDAIEAEGADNLTWFFHVDADGWPKAPWNAIAAYHPGDPYVDWIGVSVYGPQTLAEGWAGAGFARLLDRAYPRLLALPGDDPIAVLEYGARQGHPKAAWIRRAVRSVADRRWPRVRGLAYWHEGWTNSDGTRSKLWVNSDRRSLRAYRNGVGRPIFTGRARF